MFFYLDVNDKNPILKEEDYGNILLVDFEQNSPLIIHTKYDSAKFNLLSEKAQILLTTLLVYMDYSVPIATIGYDAGNIPNELFENTLNNCMENIQESYYNWLILVSTIENDALFGYGPKILILKKWALTHAKLYFTTSDIILHEGPITTKALRENEELEFEEIVVDLAMAFKNEDKSMVEKIASKHDNKYHEVIKPTLYSILLKYQLEEAIRGEKNIRKYNQNDWKKVFNIVFETVSNPINLKKYFPTTNSPHMSITYNQDYQEDQDKLYHGQIYLKTIIDQKLSINYYIVMSRSD